MWQWIEDGVVLIGLAVFLAVGYVAIVEGLYSITGG
jgi:hypothetical protein